MNESKEEKEQIIDTLTTSKNNNGIRKQIVNIFEQRLRTEFSYINVELLNKACQVLP